MNDTRKTDTRQEDSSNLKEIVFDDFVSILTVQNIKQFYSECKKKHIDIKCNKKSSGGENSTKIPKDAFMNIMSNVFSKDYRKEEKRDLNVHSNGTSNLNSQPNSIILSSAHVTSSPVKRDDMKDKIFTQLCEMIFNRFKITKCEIKTEKQKGLNDYYYINDISTDQHEIDTYEFTCALCIFPKIDFKEKMQLLFDITDVDEDGYINENEIKNLIFTVNFIFCDEETPIQSNSSIINQSLATIKSQSMFNMIMKFPGGLYKVMGVERYIDFERFYESISRIDNFKYSIIPSFINLKACLLTKKSEPEYEIEKKNLQDYLSITHEIVSCVKNTNNEIVKGSKDLKKLIDAKAEKKIMENKTKKKRNYVEENIKNVMNRNMYTRSVNQLTNSSPNMVRSNPNNKKTISDKEENLSTSQNLPLINMNSRIKDKIHGIGKNFLNMNFNYSTNPSAIDIYNINYSKIINLEAQPGKIRLKDTQTLPLTRDNLSSLNNKTENSSIERDTKDFYKNTISRTLLMTNKDMLEKKRTYISYNDIIKEIKDLSNKNHYANNEDTEEIMRLINNVKDVGAGLKNRLKDTGSNSSLIFGDFHYKKK